ncbi:hypothetical protein [Flavobacterium humidisoli]|uniref:Uncharacterized protein n=1 Tax=Flavobacterium humidisoli TaxID=2937442 RepID=A0ABY4LSR9_9FLAO|nr:hypothetical protein [Flavobacterium humidisoli]UPZ14695.1 hypothetical protein M0M44_18250 [Flavobacterium humidisoli]
MNKKFFTLLMVASLFISSITYGQEDRRIKIEIALKDGNKTVKALLRSATFSFTKTSLAAADGTDKSEVKNNYYFSLDFEKQDIALLAVLMKNKAGVDGQITMTDVFGKLPTRKFDFTKGRVDSLSDQLTADYTSAYISLLCDSLIIDGVKIE